MHSEVSWHMSASEQQHRTFASLLTAVSSPRPTWDPFGAPAAVRWCTPCPQSCGCPHHRSTAVCCCHLVSRQAEGAGGDQELHHSVSGQRRLPDQHARQQRAADAGHPGVAAPPHGVVHQSHLTGGLAVRLLLCRRASSGGPQRPVLSPLVCRRWTSIKRRWPGVKLGSSPLIKTPLARTRSSLPPTQRGLCATSASPSTTACWTTWATESRWVGGRDGPQWVSL